MQTLLLKHHNKNNNLDLGSTTDYWNQSFTYKNGTKTHESIMDKYIIANCNIGAHIHYDSNGISSVQIRERDLWGTMIPWCSKFYQDLEIIFNSNNNGDIHLQSSQRSSSQNFDNDVQGAIDYLNNHLKQPLSPHMQEKIFNTSLGGIQTEDVEQDILNPFC